MANNVDPDETCYESSHLDIHSLHRYWFWSAGLKELKTIKLMLLAQLDNWAQLFKANDVVS